MSLIFLSLEAYQVNYQMKYIKCEKVHRPVIQFIFPRRGNMNRIFLPPVTKTLETLRNRNKKNKNKKVAVVFRMLNKEYSRKSINTFPLN